MDVQDLKGWCRREMQDDAPDHLFEVLWEWAAEDRVLRDYEEDVAAGMSEPETELLERGVLEQLRKRHRWYLQMRSAEDRGQAPSPRANADQDKRLRVWLREETQERARAVAAVRARSAGQMDRARKYRNQVLQDEPVEQEQMEKLLWSFEENEEASAELVDLMILLRDVYGWSGGQTIKFLHLGETPPFEPLSASLVSAGRGGRKGKMIELVVAPWVQPDDVANTFRNLQRELLGGTGWRGGKRNLKVFCFVEELRDWRGNLPTWRRLVELWNSEHDEDPYKVARNLSRDFRRALEKMQNLFDAWKDPPVLNLEDHDADDTIPTSGSKPDRRAPSRNRRTAETTDGYPVKERR